MILRKCTYPSNSIKALYIFTPAHQAHKSFLNPSRLPGEYTAQFLPFRPI